MASRGILRAMWDWVMESGVWIMTWSLVLIGVVGTILPFLPGPLLVFGAAFIPFFALEDRGGLTVWTLVILGLALVASQVLEFMSGAVGSRWFGGSRWGAFGALVGGVIGLFFFPLGLFLGPLLGAFLSEWLFAKKSVRPASVSGVGSVIGTVGGMVIKFVLALLMGLGLLGDVYWF